MTDKAQRRTELTQYLLGQVSQEDRDEIEERYLRDDDLFEDLITAENDLIDNYVRGNLSETEKELFERHFLSAPERRERVQFAKSLMRLGGPPAPNAGEAGAVRSFWPATASFAWRWAAAAGLLVLLAGLSWLAMANLRLHHQLEAVRADQLHTQRQAQQLRQQVADLQQAMAQAGNQRTTAPPPGSASLSLMLIPGLARGSGRQVTLQLSPGISQVLLMMRRQGDEASPSYDVVLETAEGTHVWEKENVRGLHVEDSGNLVTVEIPPGILKRDDYVLRLLQPAPGAKPKELGVYSFRVVRP